MTIVVRIVSRADGSHTPHDGRFVFHWNPHTEAGVLELDSVRDPALARRFTDLDEAVREWNTVSHVQPKRPWDGAPNRPLTAVTAEICAVEWREEKA